MLVMSFGQDLKEFLKVKGLSQAEFCRVTKFNKSQVSKWISGDNTPYDSTISKIQKFYPDFITDANKNHEVVPVPEEDYMMVEYVDLRTSAGNLGGTPVEQLPDTHKRLIPKEYKKGEYLVVRVDGNSMDDNTNRALCDGDEILIRKYHLNNGDKLPFRNHLFVISSREGDVVKQIVKHDVNKGYIMCHSFNETWEDYRVNLEDVFAFFTVEKIVNRKPRF